MELIRDNVKVEWEAIGEGLYGDYWPDNPKDTELLRFYVSVLRDGRWEEKEDASYCTQFPVSASEAEKFAGLNLLLNRFYDALHDDIDVSVKKLGEELSWISPDHVHLKPHKIRVTETFVREVVVFSEDVYDAQDRVEELCNDGLIDLDAEDFSTRNTEFLGIANERDMALHQVYDQYGSQVQVGTSSLDKLIADAEAKRVDTNQKDSAAKQAER